MGFDKYRSILFAKEGELEELKDKSRDSIWKPSFHVHPQYGLLNDPNGLAYFNNEYHLFHQWNPFGPYHGMKHWAHLTSKDLVNWIRKDVAIIPKEDYESHGAYSGGALEKDDELYLYYTGNIKKSGLERDANQCLAIMNKDGEIRKYENNPVIKSVPKGYTGHVRDPKVFKKGEYYWMILGAQRENETGTLIIEKSKNAIDWEFCGELKVNGFPDKDAYMWECPDYLEIDNKDVLIFSPQGIKANGMEYNNMFTVVYLIGELDLEHLVFNTEYYSELDRGFDFYAPQSFKGKNGDNILVAWAGMGEFTYPTDEEMWSHMLTFPRILSIKNNKILSRPAKEIEILRGDKKSNQGIIDNEAIIIKNEINIYEFNLEIEFIEGNVATIEFLRGSNESLKFIINGEENKLILDKSNLSKGFAIEHGNERGCKWNFNKKIKIKALVDKSLVEIFINNGEEVFTTRAFPEVESSNIAISTKGKIKYHYSKYKIKNSISDKSI